MRPAMLDVQEGIKLNSQCSLLYYVCTQSVCMYFMTRHSITVLTPETSCTRDSCGSRALMPRPRRLCLIYSGSSHLLPISGDIDAAALPCSA